MVSRRDFLRAGVLAALAPRRSWALLPVGGSAPGAQAIPSLISRPLPVFASTGTSANATSSNYQNILTTTAMPSTVAIDVSTVSAAKLASVALYIYNEPAPNVQLYWDWATKGAGGSQNGMPLAYTIEGNTGAGGGSAPGSGWVTLVTVTGNTYTTRKHTFSLTGYNWVRMNCSSSSGTGIQVKMDLWDVHLGTRDIMFIGDSRTFFDDTHGSGGLTTSIGDLMSAYTVGGFTPPTVSAGNSGFNAANIASSIAGWLAAVPTQNVAINVGINDATAQAWSSAWSTSVQSAVNACKTAGVPNIYLEHIGYSTDSLPGDLTVYNSAIDSIVSGTSGVTAGEDLYALWQANQGWFTLGGGGDGIHLTSGGTAQFVPHLAAFYGALI